MDEKQEKWYVSFIDVIEALTGNSRPRKYWNALKTKLKAEGSELSKKLGQLKIKSADGKFYKTDVADTEQLFRLIQSIPSPKAEPFKLWLAKIADERLDEMQDPELTTGKNVIEKLAIDIKKNTGSVKGFSPRNLWFMKQFYEEYHDRKFLKQLVSELKLKQPVSVLKNEFQVLELLPWGHHILLMQKTKKDRERIYYLLASIECGWSRNVLLNQIKANAFKNHKQLPKQHNFQQALPFHLQEQADEMLKSKYNLEFPGITRPILERDFENKLLEKLKQFILELGYGFSFIGNQYRIELNRKEYFVDLLFFHRRLRCLVAIDLKIGDF